MQSLQKDSPDKIPELFRWNIYLEVSKYVTEKPDFGLELTC